MKKINILVGIIDSPNSISFLLPLIKFYNQIMEYGYKINFIFSHNHPKIFECDVFIMDCRYIYYLSTEQRMHIINFLKKKKKCYSFFYDNSDSSGTIFDDFIDIFDVYLKNQILLNTESYKKRFHGGRIYTDYFYNKFNIIDDDNYKSKSLSKKNIKKISLGWNSCFNDFSRFGGYKQSLICFFKKFSWLSFLNFSEVLRKYNSIRKHDYSCRVGINYSRKTIIYKV